MLVKKEPMHLVDRALQHPCTTPHTALVSHQASEPHPGTSVYLDGLSNFPGDSPGLNDVLRTTPDVLYIVGCRFCLLLYEQCLESLGWWSCILKPSNKLNHTESLAGYTLQQERLDGRWDCVKGSSSGQISAVTGHSHPASLALCDARHDSGCPCSKQTQSLVQSFIRIIREGLFIYKLFFSFSQSLK